MKAIVKLTGIVAIQAHSYSEKDLLLKQVKCLKAAQSVAAELLR